MSHPSPDREPADAITGMWSSPPDDQLLVDAECSPTKTCRNMVGVSFDGFAEPGTDLRQAWRAKLEREGKVADGGTSLGELVLGRSDA
ncbi:MAG TPA: hypothetical protein VIY70_06750 [Acidimicrobiia bacterium]